METHFGKYEIRDALACGAASTVYEGWDQGIARKVAIKTVALPEATDGEAQEKLSRFKREAQAAGRLHHPNIVSVFDYGETASSAYIVMEFVEAQTLKEVLDAGERLALPDILRIMDDVCAGLEYSHACGIVHRDIKPANIMLTQTGAAKITDFGIARVESSSMTQVGAVMGTPAYMSPEQLMGEMVDARTDIYSIGVVLYQMLTGERPFEGSLTTIMHKALHSEPPMPSVLSVRPPPSLDGVVAKAMSKRPQQRYASAAEFACAMHAAVETTVVVPPPRERPTQPELGLASRASFGTFAPQDANRAFDGSADRRAAYDRLGSPARPKQPGARRRQRPGMVALAAMAAVIVVSAGGLYAVLSHRPDNAIKRAGDPTSSASAPEQSTLKPLPAPRSRPLSDRQIGHRPAAVAARNSPRRPDGASTIGGPGAGGGADGSAADTPHSAGRQYPADNPIGGLARIERARSVDRCSNRSNCAGACPATQDAPRPRET